MSAFRLFGCYSYSVVFSFQFFPLVQTLGGKRFCSDYFGKRGGKVVCTLAKESVTRRMYGRKLHAEEPTGVVTLFHNFLRNRCTFRCVCSPQREHSSSLLHTFQLRCFYGPIICVFGIPSSAEIIYLLTVFKIYTDSLRPIVLL